MPPQRLTTAARRGLACKVAPWAVAALVCGLALPASAADRASGPIAGHTGVFRTTLLVEDIDKSIDFYQRLGLLKGYDKASQDTDPGGVPDAADLPLTADPKVGRLVIMKGSDDRVSSIGLLGYDKPHLASARANLIGLGTGDVIITIEVSDIETAYNRLNQIGTRFQRQPYRFTETDADGAQISGSRMYAFDPDGHMVEISQFESGRK